MDKKIQIELDIKQGILLKNLQKKTYDRIYSVSIVGVLIKAFQELDANLKENEALY